MQSHGCFFIPDFKTVSRLQTCRLKQEEKDRKEKRWKRLHAAFIRSKNAMENTKVTGKLPQKEYYVLADKYGVHVCEIIRASSLHEAIDAGRKKYHKFSRVWVEEVA